MKHRLRKKHESETYWIPPPNARVEFIPDPEIVRMRETLPSDASSADINIIPIYHTERGTFDEAGRPLTQPKRYKEIALDAWREDLAGELPSDPRNEEVEGLSDCVCAGCLRREVIPVEGITQMLGTPGPAASSRPEITVTTPVMTTVETIFPPTPISELAPEPPFAHEIVQQGHSAFFDPNSLQTEDPSQLVVPTGPYLQGQLSQLPIESNDMLDLFNAAPNLRFKVGLIKLPYRGQCPAPQPSRLLSGRPLPSSSQPMQDEFDLSLLHNNGFHNELLTSRDGAWSGVHVARTDLLDFIQLVPIA